MPEMDGWDTLGAIRQAPETRDLPVILCSVKSRPDDVARGWRAGCGGCLGKPFDIRSLVDQVRAATLRSAAERRMLREEMVTAQLAAHQRSGAGDRSV